jgi:hypothetical protein
VQCKKELSSRSGLSYVRMGIADRTPEGTDVHARHT